MRKYFRQNHPYTACQCYSNVSCDFLYTWPSHHHINWNELIDFLSHSLQRFFVCLFKAVFGLYQPSILAFASMSNHKMDILVLDSEHNRFTLQIRWGNFVTKVLQVMWPWYGQSTEWTLISVLKIRNFIVMVFWSEWKCTPTQPPVSLERWQMVIEIK